MPIITPIIYLVVILAYVIYYYVKKILPILLLTSIVLVLIGMLIKIGTQAGYAVLIVLLSGMAFLYVLYGNKALDIFKNLGTRLKDYFVKDLKPIQNMFKNDDINSTNNNSES